MLDVEAVVFDWGGVLIEDPSWGMVDYFSEHFGLVLPENEKIPFSLITEFQKGVIDEGVFWSELGKLFEIDLPRSAGSLWWEAFSSVYVEHIEMFDFANALKAQGYVTAVLSNTEMPATVGFRDMRYQAFDHLVFSCEVGMVKPDPQIYEHLVDVLSVSAGKILFLDDKEKNIRSAEKMGIQVNCVRDYRVSLEQLSYLLK